MRESTVYLLYNTNASDLKLHHGLVPNFNRKIGSREWEYEDKDEFTIMYSPSDERQYTDIKILSKTKLKERPKSADQLLKKPKVSVEGILIRKSNSLSIIEEDLFVLRRCPQIKPLLSETEIQQLQQLLKECRINKKVIDKTDSNVNHGLHKLFLDDQNLRKTTRDHKDTGLYNNTKEMPSNRIHSLSTQGPNGNKSREKDKMLFKDAKNDKTDQIKSLDIWKKSQFLNSDKLKTNEKKNNLTGTAQEVTPQKLDFVGTRYKSDFKLYKKDKIKTKQSKSIVDEDKIQNKHKKKVLEIQSQPDQKTSKKKGKTGKEDEHKEKKWREPKKDSVKSNEKNGRKTRNNENFSDHEHSLQEASFSKQKESREKSNNNIKSKDDKAKLKKNKDNEIVTSISKKTINPDKFEKFKPVNTEKTEKPDKHGENKHANAENSQKHGENTFVNTETTGKSDNYGRSKPDTNPYKLSSDENREKSSVSFSSKKHLQKGKRDKEKTTLSDEANFNGVKARSEKSTQPKSSPSDQSKATKKTKDSGIQKTSATKGRTKEKLLPGTIQYMIHYILSNPIFIDLGWTLQPTEKALSRIVTFKTVPANPRSFCFRSRDHAELKFYQSGDLALNIAEDGTGRINYPGGAPAIIMTRGHAGMKLTLYSCPRKDPLVKESFYTRIIGMFDSFGNGVVYDSNGMKILNFNQMEGVYYNVSKQTPYKWQWSCNKVLEAQRLKELLKTMIDDMKNPVPTTKQGRVVKALDSGSSRKSVTSLEKKPADKIYEAILEELPYPVMPNSKIKVKTHNNAFKSITHKINEEITVRINGQHSVAVNFSARTLFYKMDLGVRVDPESVERIDEVAGNRVESVPNVLTDLLHPTQSLQKLHRLLDPNNVH